MKKIISLTTALLLVMGLTACGDTNNSGNNSKKPSVSANSSVIVSSDTQTSENTDTDVDLDFNSNSKIELPDVELEDDYTVSSESSSTTAPNKDTSSSSVTSVGTSSKDTTSKNNTSLNNTSSKDTVSENNISSKNESTSNESHSNNTSSNASPSIVTEFINTNNPNYTHGKLTIHPRHVYWKDGQLVAQCFIVNGLNESLSKVVVKRLTFTNGNNQVLADAAFTNSPINFISAIGRTLNHGENVVWEFTFSADTVKNYGADLSRIIIDSSTNNYK